MRPGIVPGVVYAVGLVALWIGYGYPAALLWMVTWLVAYGSLVIEDARQDRRNARRLRRMTEEANR